MPIEEPGIYRPSNLTKKQQAEQLAACYGVDTVSKFTAEEVAIARRILAQAEDDVKPVTVHDLNNPPREAYRFQPFPQMVYDLQNSFPAHVTEQIERVKGVPYKPGDHVPAQIVFRIVKSADELEAALAEGWSAQAPEFRDQESSMADGATKYQGEAERVQTQIDEAKTRRGPRIGRSLAV